MFQKALSKVPAAIRLALFVLFIAGEALLIDRYVGGVVFGDRRAAVKLQAAVACGLLFGSATLLLVLNGRTTFVRLACLGTSLCIAAILVSSAWICSRFFSSMTSSGLALSRQPPGRWILPIRSR